MLTRQVKFYIALFIVISSTILYHELTKRPSFPMTRPDDLIIRLTYKSLTAQWAEITFRHGTNDPCSFLWQSFGGVVSRAEYSISVAELDALFEYIRSKKFEKMPSKTNERTFYGNTEIHVSSGKHKYHQTVSDVDMPVETPQRTAYEDIVRSILKLHVSSIQAKSGFDWFNLELELPSLTRLFRDLVSTSALDPVHFEIRSDYSDRDVVLPPTTIAYYREAPIQSHINSNHKISSSLTAVSPGGVGSDSDSDSGAIADSDAFPWYSSSSSNNNYNSGNGIKDETVKIFYRKGPVRLAIVFLSSSPPPVTHDTTTTKTTTSTSTTTPASEGTLLSSTSKASDSGSSSGSSSNSSDEPAAVYAESPKEIGRIISNEITLSAGSTYRLQIVTVETSSSSSSSSDNNNKTPRYRLQITELD